MRINSPCKGCQDRYLGCHDRCDSFKDFKDKTEIQNELIHKEKSVLNMHISFICEQKEKTRRHKGI